MSLFSSVKNSSPFRRLFPNDYSAHKTGGLKEKVPTLRIDYHGSLDEKRLMAAIMGYMETKRWLVVEKNLHNKGADHDHKIMGFKRYTEYYRASCDIRVRLHDGKRNEGDPSRPDKGFLRIWLGEKPWSIDKDYQGWYQTDAVTMGLRNFFDRNIFRKEFESTFVAELISDLYGLAEVIKKELGIETIAYEGGAKKRRTWS